MPEPLPKRMVFDADAWREAGGDVGDNSCFWKPAEILQVAGSHGEDTTCWVRFPDGRQSGGHIYAMTKPLPDESTSQ